MFGNEQTAVIEGLPTLQDSATFFQTDSAGPVTANLEDMQQDSTSDAEDAAPADMDQSDLPAPAPVKQSAGQSQFLSIYHCASSSEQAQLVHTFVISLRIYLYIIFCFSERHCQLSWTPDNRHICVVWASLSSEYQVAFAHADQAAQLYAASNQFNPHEARAAKKKAKKQQKRASGEAYDFAEAFGAKTAV